MSLPQSKAKTTPAIGAATKASGTEQRSDAFSKAANVQANETKDQT